MPDYSFPEIYFYLPVKDWFNKIPSSPAQYWSGYIANMATSVYHWTVQTYLYLKQDGFNCIPTDTFPKKGIVLSNRFYLPDNLKPSSELLLVCLEADNRRHPFAQIHIVLNEKNKMVNRRNKLWAGHYIPLWPQIGIIPRNPLRGIRFENIAYIGDPKNNLAPELRSAHWAAALNELGLSWHIIDKKELWNDFSNIDAIVAVRSFDKNPHSNKPATKLYNAWLGGVPAILGPESAYRAERKNELDFIEVKTMKEALDAVKRLRDNKNLRDKMVTNGKLRARDIAPAKFIERWRHFLHEVAPMAYDDWRAMPNWKKQIYFIRRYIEYKTEGAILRWRSICKKS